MKQLGLHFASKQPKLMFRHFDIENGTAELTLKRVKPKRTQVLQKSSRNGTNSTVNADFRCQYTQTLRLTAAFIFRTRQLVFSIP